MDGLMDNNETLRSPLLYFVDEAIGYRHSLHFFHRWLITGEQSELEALIIEVGRENFVDLWPLLNYVNNGNQSDGIIALQESRKRGLYVPAGWHDKQVRLTPLIFDLFSAEYDIGTAATNSWALRDWVDTNKRGGTNPLAILGMQVQLLLDSRSHFLTVFKLLNMFFGKTLLSCVIDDDVELLSDILSTYYPKQEVHIKKLAYVMSKNADLNWKDALSRNQIKSKLWLLEHLINQKLIPKRSILLKETTTVVVGGWVGMIPFLASMNQVNLDSVINMDIDTSVLQAAYELNINTHENFRNSDEDVRKADLVQYKKLVVIDTIVEHFEKHGEWVSTLPPGTSVVLQGNDMFDVPDHVNCHSSLEEFISDCGLNTILWSGELMLDKCTRFMAIGKV